MDRYLRFGHPAVDAQIGRYVDLIDFDRDEVFGVFNRRLQLIAMAHLAYLGDSQRPHAAEFGVSVLPRYRGRGFGAPPVRPRHAARPQPARGHLDRARAVGEHADAAHRPLGRRHASSATAGTPRRC